MIRKSMNDSVTPLYNTHLGYFNKKEHHLTHTSFSGLMGNVIVKKNYLQSEIINIMSANNNLLSRSIMYCDRHIAKIIGNYPLSTDDNAKLT